MNCEFIQKTCRQIYIKNSQFNDYENCEIIDLWTFMIYISQIIYGIIKLQHILHLHFLFFYFFIKFHIPLISNFHKSVAKTADF